LYEKIDEARLDRSVADERLKLFRLVMCSHVSNNTSLIDHNCHEDLSPERFGSPSRQKKALLLITISGQMLCPPLKRSQVLQLSRQSCIHYTRAIVLVSGKYLLSYFHLLALMGPITGHVIRNQRFSGAAVKILQISKIITRSLIHSINLRSIIYRHYVKKKI
ncbi:hypothetical protein ALC53_11758, partial [Atta colombica]